MLTYSNINCNCNCNYFTFSLFGAGSIIKMQAVHYGGFTDIWHWNNVLHLQILKGLLKNGTFCININFAKKYRFQLCNWQKMIHLWKVFFINLDYTFSLKPGVGAPTVISSPFLVFHIFRLFFLKNVYIKNLCKFHYEPFWIRICYNICD